MIDVVQQINAVRRQVGSRTIEAGEARTVTVSQTYPAAVEDLWDAVTNQERIPRWFSPVSGELKLGGRYQVEGNAGGVVERCDPPKSFAATWEFNGQVSWIEVRLTPEGDERTRFELDHIALVDDEGLAFWELYGPGAVGLGWDLAFIGLALHTAAGADVAVDPKEVEAWTMSDEGKRFIGLASERWRDANVDSGFATPEGAQAAADRTTAFYTGAEAPQQG
ncbi:SRPBCC family protein [Jiangella rhizosphaerae]|uniref:Polyketide cyclase n=1 Tax=Jiangella rhizosphaerae TaxID=2293569 RepID=A0A418KWZ3_9ACTN|nr:SRPBCC family protein [Jiangella rhizosphaerae]RIQ37407.1 polyketide cyclase [Jiangella rhizosphaerae]